jgi:hypothetical protein
MPFTMGNEFGQDFKRVFDMKAVRGGILSSLECCTPRRLLWNEPDPKTGTTTP